MDLICEGLSKRMEKANNMITDSNLTRWYILYTMPRSEHKLMQRLNAAGYNAFCPMQAVSVKWSGRIKEITFPLFPGCLFVAGDITEMVSFVSFEKAAFLVDDKGEKLVIDADKADLSSKFIQLLKL